jgi:hypothetical protein
MLKPVLVATCDIPMRYLNWSIMHQVRLLSSWEQSLVSMLHFCILNFHSWDYYYLTRWNVGCSVYPLICNFLPWSVLLHCSQCSCSYLWAIDALDCHLSSTFTLYISLGRSCEIINIVWSPLMAALFMHRSEFVIIWSYSLSVIPPFLPCNEALCLGTFYLFRTWFLCVRY